MFKQSLKNNLQSMTTIINEINNKVNSPHYDDVEEEIMRSSVSLRILITRLEFLVKGKSKPYGK